MIFPASRFDTTLIAHGSVLLSGELFRSLYYPTGHFRAIWPKVFQKNLPMPETIGRLLSISDDVLQKACATCDFIHQGDVLISFEGSLQVKQ